jgi:hypothetical protein
MIRSRLVKRGQHHPGNQLAQPGLAGARSLSQVPAWAARRRSPVIAVEHPGRPITAISITDTDMTPTIDQAIAATAPAEGRPPSPIGP